MASDVDISFSTTNDSCTPIKKNLSTGKSYSQIYQLPFTPPVTKTDLPYPTIIDKDGKSIELTYNNISSTTITNKGNIPLKGVPIPINSITIDLNNMLKHVKNPFSSQQRRQSVNRSPFTPHPRPPTT